ncbi:uncharacterized protein BCR38DRAFT_71665 [Pseudomassariella vexata]|uniref:Uncharacterized protein n=1 Tax=Pseudomassariella vexata TaxID=1141098 RepID=A0A1Y2DIB0_9PEZI|nr:uncharacterized protein BCR38DRAFT_71665 [Pseudomassariella vexata]ORY58894.1 hypothetical protein BCR38DRAFT_71665 [Pseudomassariella vexata]
MTAPLSRLAKPLGSLWTTKASLSQTLSHVTGTARRRFPRQSESPTRILALRTQRKHPVARSRYGAMFRRVARQMNERLPVLTLQKLLKLEDLQDEKGLAAILEQVDPNIWKDRLNSLATRGWSEEHIDHWVWILSAEDADARVRRFVFTDTPQPVFLLMVLLQNSHSFRSFESLKLVLDYVNKFYCSRERPIHDLRLALMPLTFLRLLRRLVGHVYRIWPRAIVRLAQLAKDYIQTIPRLAGDYRVKNGKAYRDRCLVFNYALVSFSRPSYIEPLLQRDFNWRAQRLLLSMSDGLESPLVIDKASYRSIRKVMIGLRKSQAEREVAMRYAKTWPPYRQDFDGHDVKRTPEGDQTRSVKAGVLMQEAGYEEDEYDKALGALGGSTTESPTIQTRSLPPKEWIGDKESNNFYTLWASKVRATRNAREAWKAFTSFSDVEPTAQVYAEILMKLRARAATPSIHLLPGDARENLPIHDANYSEYELARLSPPTRDELYSHMLEQGIRPNGTCLTQLVSHASSVEEGLHYLSDSPINSTSVTHLSLFKVPALEHLHKIPLMAFNSYIQLLCRLQPDRRGAERLGTEELYRIRHAIRLVSMRLRPDTTEGATFRPPWQNIARALARPYVAVINGAQIDNDIVALKMFLHCYAAAQKCHGIDGELFIYLCRTVQKLVLSYLELCNSPIEADLQSPAMSDTRLRAVLDEAQGVMRTTFSKMTMVPVESGGESLLPSCGHVITPIQLHMYMRAMALVDDVTGMVNLMDWIFRNKDVIAREAQLRGNRGHAMMAKTLCAFEAFAGPKLDMDKRVELDARMNDITEVDPSWRWPTAEEIEDYIDLDQRGGSQRLHQKIIAQWWQQDAGRKESGQEQRTAAG